MTDWPLTFKCNNNCISCIIDEDAIKHEPPIEQIKKIIDSIGPDDYLGLSGGEPTIREEFFDILKYAKKRIPNNFIFLVSNGRMFSYEDFVKNLAKLKMPNFRIGIGMYGPNPEIHDSITRSKGSFDQTDKGIKNLLKYDIPVEIRLIISKMNYKYLPEFAEYVSNKFKGIFRVVLVNMKYTGNAYKNRDKLFVKCTDVVPYAQKAVDILEKNKIECLLFHFPLCILNEKYRKNAEGVTKQKYELAFVDDCEKCSVKDKCPMIWKSYLDLVGSEEFKAL